MQAQAAKQYPCGGCMKPKNAQRFSESALKRYDAGIEQARNRNRSLTSVRKPICSDCRVTSVHELECAKCDMVKTLEGFSKQQRKRGDERECRDCVQEREDREPNFQDEVREKEIMERLQNGLGSLSTIPSVLDRMTNSQMSRLQSTHEESLISEEHDASLQNQTNRFHHVQQAHTKTGSEPSSTTTTNTGWDSFERVHASYRSRISQRYASPKSDSNSSRFAKTNAVRPDAETKAAIQLERQQRREQEAAEQAAYRDSSEDSDSDDAPPY